MQKKTPLIEAGDSGDADEVGYLRIGAQLRQMIVEGRLRPGDRLPPEVELRDLLQVSRGTLREALKVLASQRLITTVRGPGGGNIVTVPRTTDVSDGLRVPLAIMAGSDEASVDELLQARELLEVPTAQLAASRRTDEVLARLRATIPPEYENLSRERIFEINRAFHQAVVQAAGNRVVLMLAEPIFGALQSRVRQVDVQTWRRIRGEHAAILAAIEAGDGDLAAALMRSHLRAVRPNYRDRHELHSADGDAFPRQAVPG